MFAQKSVPEKYFFELTLLIFKRVIKKCLNLFFKGIFSVKNHPNLSDIFHLEISSWPTYQFCKNQILINRHPWKSIACFPWSEQKIRVTLKLYIPGTINTQMNLVFLRFLGRFGLQGITEKLCNFAKVLNFFGWFWSYFRWYNK